MRMRKRPNLDRRMEKCNDLIENNPEMLKGKWLEEFKEYEELELELGCGKGRFTIETAKLGRKILLVAVEKVESAMIIALERAKNAELDNVRFVSGDVKELANMFENEEVSKIYINFCDPWPKSRDAKFRLTAPSFLRKYSDILRAGGVVKFKTDNRPLFDWSLEQFRSEGWDLPEITYDLHENGPKGIMTDYEQKFYAEGQKINALTAVKTPATKQSSDGEVPRLRNAALSDAKGLQQD